MKNKRAISAVVATVLLVLITVALISVLALVVIPWVSDLLTFSSACANVELTIGRAGYTCYDNTRTYVQIIRGPKESQLSGIQVKYTKAGNSVIDTIDQTNLPLPGGSKVYNYSSVVDEVSIAPIVKLGKTQRICSDVDRITLTACAS